MIEYRIKIERGELTVTQRIESASKTMRKVHPKGAQNQVGDDDDRSVAGPVNPIARGEGRSMSLPSKFPRASGVSHPVPAPDECSCPVAIVFGPIILFGSLDDIVGGPEDKSGTGS